jgi:nucleotide-binding universal stress UspA family protein
MRSLHRILVAVGTYENSQSAAQLAISLASESPQAEIIFCHVIDIPRLLARCEQFTGDYELLFNTARQTAAQTLERCCTLADEFRIPARSYVRFGEPADELVRFADTLAADVIVIGHRHKSKIDRFLNGSLCDEVVHAGTIPILAA